MTINQDLSAESSIRVPAPRHAEADKLATLAAMPLLEGVSTAQLKKVAELVSLEHRSAGELMIREGAPSDSVIVLVHGYATATQQGRPLGVAGAGELLGDPAQLLSRVSTMSWTTDTEVVLLRATRQAARELYALLPQIYVRLTGTIEEVEALKAGDDQQDWSWAVGLLGTLFFLALITGAVYVAGGLGAFQ